MSYTPKPIDTSKVNLPDNLSGLVEILAKNNHDTWAQQRMAAGWSYGPQRDDRQKLHPCLVPYDELPESEKGIDRKTALEIVKVLLAFGVQIESSDKRLHSLLKDENDSSNIPDQAKNFIDNPDSYNSNMLIGLWHSLRAESKQIPLNINQKLGERLLALGEPLFAYDVVSEGLERNPEDIRLRQLISLALIRSGTPQKANSVIIKLFEEGHKDEETIGLLARTYKEIWEQEKDSDHRTGHLKKAFETYSLAFELNHGYWSGINAATTALLLGKQDQAINIAKKVREICKDKIKEDDGDDSERYWLIATLGECALILGESSEAEDLYAQASSIGRNRYGDLLSTRHNAKLLLEHSGKESDPILKHLQIPRVAVFSGHMIDQPGRSDSRFPPEAEEKVYRKILANIKRLNIGFGYSSAACGSDILFQEAVREVGGESYIVLPYDKEQFRQDSIDIIPGNLWKDRYYQTLDRATLVDYASDHKPEESHVAYEYTNQLLLGLAQIRAEHFDTNLIPLVVWDGKVGDRPGGTASVVEQWTDLGFDIESLDLKNLTSKKIKKQKLSGKKTSKKSISVMPEKNSTKVMAILFADAVGFSKLSENEVALFNKHFMGAISNLVSKSPNAPITKNTWGDALYFVFSTIRLGGVFALQLCDLINETDWNKKGLPGSISLRIGLHVGPVLSCIDPITKASTYIGTHVSRTARIEPITPPGQVYSSQQFAALASAEQIEDFTCDYVGQTPMAKGYGTFPTYHLRRKKSKN